MQLKSYKQERGNVCNWRVINKKDVTYAIKES